jgi:hypothetical protein
MNTLRQFIGRVKLQLRGKNHIVGWSMTSDEAIAFIKSRGKTVLTFYGYSGMQYQDEKGMLQIAQNVLSRYSPEKTLVNIGVTRVGVGAIYSLAKSMGFETTGVVATRALKRPEGISEAVDHICFINDRQSGGKLPESDELSPTSKAMVGCSDILVGIGGGGISQDEMLAGKAQGKPVYFYPADHNHELAIRQAKKGGLPLPDSFKGTAHEVFAMGEESALKPSENETEDV